MRCCTEAHACLRVPWRSLLAHPHVKKKSWPSLLRGKEAWNVTPEPSRWNADWSVCYKEPGLSVLIFFFISPPPPLLLCGSFVPHKSGKITNVSLACGCMCFNTYLRNHASVSYSCLLLYAFLVWIRLVLWAEEIWGNILLEKKKKVTRSAKILPSVPIAVSGHAPYI